MVVDLVYCGIYSVVLYGMAFDILVVKCDIVWYHGMVWSGMAYGMIIGVVLCGMVWYGMVWYGMVWYGMIWYGMV
jgi:chloride channel 2